VAEIFRDPVPIARDRDHSSDLCKSPPATKKFIHGIILVATPYAIGTRGTLNWALTTFTQVWRLFAAFHGK